MVETSTHSGDLQSCVSSILDLQSILALTAEKTQTFLKIVLFPF